MIPCTGRALFLCRDDYGLRDTIADLLLLFQASNLGIYYTPFRSAVFSVDSAKKEKNPLAIRYLRQAPNLRAQTQKPLGKG